jgi:hypothetical protein
LKAFWEAVRAAPAGPAVDGHKVTPGGPRVAGPPRSSNGASSFHLIWDLPRSPQTSRLVEVSVTLEIVEPPRVPALYFWALQVGFADGHGHMWGGGHTGLQWNRRFPEGTAANWGGYASQDRGGAVLTGTDPDLFSFAGDPNTMAYGWGQGRPYRFRIYRSPEVAGAWRSAVTDLVSGETTVLRDLVYPGASRARHPRGGGDPGYLFRPMVWSEVFADCDAPPVVARWSDLTALSEDGDAIAPSAVMVNYQSHQAGGCANTTVRRDGAGLLQVTNVPREVEQGRRLEFGGS